MFETHHFENSTAMRSIPVGRYYAVGIAGESDIDICKVNGQLIAPGAPALFDGAPRSLTVETMRPLVTNTIAGATLRLVTVTNPAGLAALPRKRAPWLYRQNIPQSVQTDIIVPFCGRRHLTVGVITTIAATITLIGSRAGAYVVLTGPTSGGTGNGYAYEVGGTDNEECFDIITVRVSAGAAQTGVGIFAYGELGG